MEDWNIPKNFALDVILNSKSLRPPDAARKLFGAICQFKGIDLVFSNRLQVQIQKYISSVRSYLKRARLSKKGFEDLRKRDEKKVWPCKVLLTEYSISVMKSERDSLLLQNHRLKKKVGGVKSRLKKIKQKYKSQKRKQRKLKLLQKKISVQIIRKAKQMKNAPKAFKESSRFWRHALRTSLQDKCKLALSCIGVNHEAYDITVRNKTTKKFEKITLIDDVCDGNEDGDANCGGGLSEEKLELIRLLILIKDENNMSDRAYAAIASITDLPTLYSLKAEMDKANKSVVFHKTLGTEPGVERDLEAMLKEKIEVLAEEGVVGREKNKIYVKLSGDGTQVGKKNHFVNIACTVLNDEQTATSERGHDPVAIINSSEKYEVLKPHLVNIVKTVESFTTYTHDGIEYEIVYYLAGDYKFLLEILGLCAANSNYSCIYCTKHKSKYYDHSIKGQLRTIQEIIDNSKKADSSKSKFGCKREPIFKTIPLDRVLIDTLHMFLRITDRLIEKLVRDCETADKRQRGNKGTPHMDALAKMFEECGLHGVSFFASGSSDVKKPRDLTGPEMLKLYANLDKIESVLLLCGQRSEGQNAKVISIWREFFAIYNLIRSFGTLATSADVSQLQQLTRQWLGLYTSVFTIENIKPYMHLFMDHIPSLISAHGSLHIFNTQGLEKKNHVITVDYFRSTNHRRGPQGIESLSQLMQKFNRRSYLLKHKIRLQKRLRNCSNCHETGHDIRICPKK